MTLTKPALFRISICHRVPYVEVARLADDIEHRGRIEFREINSLSDQMQNLIADVHAAVREDQVRRGIINAGEDSKIIPRKLNG
jgi:hypothetical protein